jgi:hypothetical protein
MLFSFNSFPRIAQKMLQLSAAARGYLKKQTIFKPSVITITSAHRYPDCTIL